jgi:hypothetical protein
MKYMLCLVGQDSTVGIKTRCGLDGLGIEILAADAMEDVSMGQATMDLRELLTGDIKRCEGSEGHSISDMRYNVRDKIDVGSD